MNRQEGMASFFLIGSELRAAGVAIGSHRATHLPLSLLAGYGSDFAFANGKNWQYACSPIRRTFSVDDAAVQQHVEAAEKIVDVLDGGVFADRNPHEVHEPGRAVALE